MKEVDETANLVVGVLKCSRAGDTDGRTGQIQVPDPIDVTEVGEREPRRVPADDTDQASIVKLSGACSVPGTSG